MSSYTTYCLQPAPNVSEYTPAASVFADALPPIHAGSYPLATYPQPYPYPPSFSLQQFRPQLPPPPAMHPQYAPAGRYSYPHVSRTRRDAQRGRSACHEQPSVYETSTSPAPARAFYAPWEPLPPSHAAKSRTCNKENDTATDGAKPLERQPYGTRGSSRDDFSSRLLQVEVRARQYTNENASDSAATEIRGNPSPDFNPNTTQETYSTHLGLSLADMDARRQLEAGFKAEGLKAAHAGAAWE
ncbi:hypothetical protein B0H14DRAFT_3483922 [Mycena olivaceomarginata]|nr:hypothetical protein B0H14DRAFT_3483922 [Mycena olivaceomarginata]